jgi:histidinol-phosphate aminotransferase
VLPEQVVIGTGSGEVLNAIALAWKPRGAYLGADLFWDTTAKWAVKLGATLKTVPMTAAMEVDLPGIAAAVDDSIGLIHIVNPNNPTGLLIDGNALRGFIKTVAPKKTVLIDEAYNELVPDPDYSSMIDMVRAGHDVIITRTFSKIFGMAGMRIGYAISSPANAALIRSYMMTSLNAAGLAGAIASFEEESFKTFSKAKIVEAREMIAASAKSAGLELLTPSANFAYVKVADANAVQKAMAAKGVLIRGAYGKWTSWSRVSTGKIEDVARYCKALPEAVGA